ncbi:hypothetical protein [Phaeobacter inhibens]|uniref:Uncharacterized protein n=1 Tax=Phaeobacter inhibens TaxID=221822 RepID=A0A2I7KFL5_9RHOB|nr:hypothetical protein [Phaeobacter inhibens]AUR01376.1 hypothetical protein PhaeoP88_04064 [Phaeobacter inhibens]
MSNTRLAAKYREALQSISFGEKATRKITEEILDAFVLDRLKDAYVIYAEQELRKTDEILSFEDWIEKYSDDNPEEFQLTVKAAIYEASKRAIEIERSQRRVSLTVNVGRGFEVFSANPYFLANALLCIFAGISVLSVIVISPGFLGLAIGQLPPLLGLAMIFGLGLVWLVWRRNDEHR